MDKQKKAAGAETDRQLAAAVQESATQIWLAGLGAFAAAQQQGSKIFEALVEQGTAVRERTRRVANERIEELTAQATENWERLGHLLEDPLGRALHRLNLPTRKDIDELNHRLDKLAAATEKLSEGSSKHGAHTRT